MTERENSGLEPLGSVGLSVFMEPGVPLRIKPGVVEALIAKARRERARAMREMFVAAWRLAFGRPASVPHRAAAA